jgi:hypothetical protein
MKRIIAAAVAATTLGVPGALAQERTGDAALGALSGAIVLGPVGAVAGAVIGYTAGPAIASSWGLRRSERRYRTRSAAPVNQGASPGLAAGGAYAQGAANQRAAKEVATPPAEH